MNEEIYELLQQQNADLAAMVNKYQHEIIPQYEKVLDRAQMEREALIKATEKVAQENEVLLRYLKTFKGCHVCKHKHGQAPDVCPGCNCSRCSEECACAGCDELSKWQWEGLKESKKGGQT